MNERQVRVNPLPNPLTPAALVHIATLAERADQGLEQRCARHRRRASACRVVVAGGLLAIFGLGANTAYAKPLPYAGITTTGQMDSAQVCAAIDIILGRP